VELAKGHLDVGLYTNEAEAALGFWRDEVGLPYEELLKAGGGVHQHRFGLNGSVLKVNHARDPLPPAPISGYRELFVARDGLAEPQTHIDPGGNRVTLVPPGSDGIVGIAVSLGVRDEDAFRRFYGDALGFEEVDARCYRCGDSLLRFERDPNAVSDQAMFAAGYRYLTVQVHSVDREHAGLLARGATEARAPFTLGETARISFVRDPDGNYVEISQRKSLTGSLEASAEP